MNRYSPILHKALSASFSLVEEGYEYSGVKDAHTSALGHYLEATFIHPRTQRKISVAYFPEPSDPRAREAVCVHITNNARDTRSGTFMVDDYLKHKGADPKVLEALVLSSYPGSAAEKLESVLAQVNRLLRSDLKDVVAGETWVDVPMDWAGYR